MGPHKIRIRETFGQIHSGDGKREVRQWQWDWRRRGTLGTCRKSNLQDGGTDLEGGVAAACFGHQMNGN